LTTPVQAATAIIDFGVMDDITTTIETTSIKRDRPVCNRRQTRSW
jgi:hypothetical protein